MAKISIDDAANEAYVSDGYGNHRVVVMDMDTGKFKRYWGAYGKKPDDTPLGNYNPDAPLAKQFRTPVHCAEPTKDGMVYVCDRPNDRIQVFTKDGKFVKETQVAKMTRGDGSVWDIAFSKDAEQKYIYLADGANEKICVFDRQSLDRADHRSATAAASPASSTPCTASRPTRRATSTRPRPIAASASRSSSTRASRR